MNPANPTKGIIFYADDDEDDLILLKESFSCFPEVEVITARDGVEALRYLSGIPEGAPIPCLIILDINMPRKNGKEALVEIRKMKRYEKTPVVMFTTSSQVSDKEFSEIYRAGFITKPIDGKQMEYIADTFIEHCSESVRRIFQRRLEKR